MIGKGVTRDCTFVGIWERIGRNNMHSQQIFLKRLVLYVKICNHLWSELLILLASFPIILWFFEIVLDFLKPLIKRNALGDDFSSKNVFGRHKINKIERERQLIFHIIGLYLIINCIMPPLSSVLYMTVNFLQLLS